MKASSWRALGFASLLAACTLATEAVELNHAAISRRVVHEVQKAYGPDAANRIVAWNALVKANTDKTVAEKLALANDFFNQVPVKTEEQIWGHSHWSTPFEMLLHNAGSYADHAIAKYVTLEAMNVEIDRMKLTHVHAMKSTDTGYLVLTYQEKPGVMPVVLDTLDRQIKPANERQDLFPEHSINDNGIWLSSRQKDGRNDAEEEAKKHVELWNEMNARLDKEHLSTEDPEQMW